jgi:Tol biopolymer transport system component
LNPDSPTDTDGVASPDGKVAFSYTGGDIYWTGASGGGAPELLVKSPYIKHPNDISLDGRFLIYDEHHPTRMQDLYVVSLAAAGGADRKPIPFLVTNADETFAQFSPDGKWVAYSSDESGQREVYVQGFDPTRVPAKGAGKWLISAGGDKPRWRRDGKELYYLALDGKMMAVPIKTTSVFEPGLPVALFTTPRTYGWAPYDVSPDGRFLVNTLSATAASNASPVTVVLNWQAGLNK